MVQSDRPHMKICSMRLVCWIHKATNRQSEYVILVAFPTQLLHERPSMLCYTYIAYLNEVRFITNKFCELIYCVFLRRKLRLFIRDVREAVSGYKDWRKE
jgi:hypothetical protein